MDDIFLVSPGQLLTSDKSFMRYQSFSFLHQRGHGTFMKDDAIYSALSGVVEKVNRLICVKALKSRYTGDIGDVVLGRIVETGAKRWKVDINSRQDGILTLSSINLPGGAQRRKCEADELQMRSFYQEGDIICAEVQSCFQDGSLGIHTRSLKYGKLSYGVLMNVSPFLIKRSRSQFITLSKQLSVILGLNGNIWIGMINSEDQQNDGPLPETAQNTILVITAIERLSSRNIEICEASLRSLLCEI